MKINIHWLFICFIHYKYIRLTFKHESLSTSANISTAAGKNLYLYKFTNFILVERIIKILLLKTYIYIHIYTYMQIHNVYIYIYTLVMYMCVRGRVCVFIYTHIHIFWCQGKLYQQTSPQNTNITEIWVLNY